MLTFVCPAGTAVVDQFELVFCGRLTDFTDFDGDITGSAARHSLNPVPGKEHSQCRIVPGTFDDFVVSVDEGVGGSPKLGPPVFAPVLDSLLFSTVAQEDIVKVTLLATEEEFGVGDSEFPATLVTLASAFLDIGIRPLWAGRVPHTEVLGLGLTSYYVSRNQATRVTDNVVGHDEMKVGWCIIAIQ